MAISRGHRKVSKAKAEAELTKKQNLTIKAQSKKKRKKHLKVPTGEKQYSKRKRVRARYKYKQDYSPELKRAKRLAIKEKKKAKKQAYTKGKTKIIEPKSEQQKAIDKQLKQFKKEWENQLEEQRREEQQNFLDDIIYSTFEANLNEMGEYDEILKEIVQHSIDSFGFEEAMKRLEDYMYSERDKNNIFNVPLNYDGVAIKAISKFVSVMYGRVLSLEEIRSYESRLDYLTDTSNYKGSHGAITYLRSITDE